MEAVILARLGNTGIRLSEWLSRTRGRIVGMVLAAAFWQVSHGLGIGIPAELACSNAANHAPLAPLPLNAGAPGTHLMDSKSASIKLPQN